jgi:hypothetical protein
MGIDNFTNAVSSLSQDIVKTAQAFDGLFNRPTPTVATPPLADTNTPRTAPAPVAAGSSWQLGGGAVLLAIVLILWLMPSRR